MSRRPDANAFPHRSRWQQPCRRLCESFLGYGKVAEIANKVGRDGEDWGASATGRDEPDARISNRCRPCGEPTRPSLLTVDPISIFLYRWSLTLLGMIR